MRLDEVREQLRGHGAREPHVVHLLRQWIETKPLGSGGRKPADFLPLRLREALPALQRSLDDIARVSSSHPARDGSTRLLMALADGQSIETVLLPPAQEKQAAFEQCYECCSVLGNHTVARDPATARARVRYSSSPQAHLALGGRSPARVAHRHDVRLHRLVRCI
jgi:hypothetical protein